MGLKLILNALTNLLLPSSLTKLNQNFTKISDEFDKVLYADGSASVTGTIDFNSNRLINIPFAASDSEPVTLAQASVLANFPFGGGALVGPLSVPLLTVRKGGSATEGGEIRLEKPTITALTGDVVLDVANDRFRIFENGGTARGWTLNLLDGAPGAASNIVDRANHIGVQPVSSITGLQAILDAKATPAYIKGLLGSREANVLDIADWDNKGNNDNATGYQTLINQAAAANVPVTMGGGKALLSKTILLPDGHTFKGKGGTGFNYNPERASTFYLAHTGRGFTRTGTGDASISLTDIATLRAQPAVVSGTAWTPSDHDFDFYFPDISDLKIRRLHSTNSTRGIYMNGGRNTINEWNGQFFKVGLQMDWSYDTCHLTDLHHWPFWNQSAEVKNWSQANLISFLLKRVDNAFMHNIFSIWHSYGFYIDQFAGDGPNKPAGTASKLKISNADIDIGNTAYYVAAGANGHTAKFSNFTAQGRDEITAGSLLMQVNGPNTIITGDFTTDLTGANAIRLGATSTGSQIALQVGANAWNRTGGGFPAVEVEAGGGKVDILPGSIFRNGGTAPISAGNVTVWKTA